MRNVTVSVVFAAAVAALFAVLGDRVAAADGLLEVHFLDVGQADATLLLHDDAAVLVDAGDWRRTDVVDQLAELGVDELDLVMVTHPHADHIGQFDVVMDTFEVAEVWWSGTTTTSQTFERAVDALEASDAAYAEPRAGDTTTIGPLTLEVVNPPEGVDVSDIHDANLAMRATYGDVRVLFTGDAEAPAEQYMVDTSPELLDADIYQVGHHGSSTSTTVPFLSAVDPAVAIWSASEGNQYGHPHDVVIDRFDGAGVEVFGTATHGGVVVTTDGTQVTVQPDRGEPFVFAVDGTEPAPAPEPVPDGPVFSDIAGTTHEAAIVAVADAQIAGGFADDTFRPGEPVTRGQMGTFLTRALDLPPFSPDDDGELSCVDINSADTDLLEQIVHIGADRAQAIVDGRPWVTVDDLDQLTGIGPARLDDIRQEGLAQTSCPDGNDAGGLPVSDVAGTTHADSILAVIQAEIAGGFPDGTYRPGEPVTRGQMATFLTRALDLPTGAESFPDTVGTTHEDAIAAVLEAGITGGFADGTYRPGEPVTRGQMATFLARSLELDH